MRWPPLHLRVFLASPGDVTSERTLARGVLSDLPSDAFLRGRVTIEVVASEQVPMPATITPQRAIETVLPKPSECDIVVVILWSRIGTPLPPEYTKPDGSPYLSGTEWEYLDAYEASRRNDDWPAVLVYRRTQPVRIVSNDPLRKEKLRQVELVEEFFERYRNPDGSFRGGYKEYRKPHECQILLYKNLHDVIAGRLKTAGATAPDTGGGIEVGARSAPVWAGSPFPGLRAFTPDDAPIFFGRGRETDELVERLAEEATRFIVVVGASGSGKSSLIAAGLLPRLGAGGVEGSQDWLLPWVQTVGGGRRTEWVGLRFTPGELDDNPFLALAFSLRPFLPAHAGTPRDLAERLEADAGALAQIIGAALTGRPQRAEALLFVDQFEELFTMVAEARRSRFVDLLGTAARVPRLRVVATLRSDFYDRCVEWPVLAELLRTASFPLARPERSALLEMVKQPAARAELEFEDGLPERMLNEMGTGPGALALLAFALNELYVASRATGGRLTHSVYDGFGGVRKAIGRCADATFEGLAEPVKDRLSDVFRELVDVEDEKGVATRRRAVRERLASSPEAGRLVDAFVNARLLVSDRGPGRQTIIEVAHEALLREWPRLARWVAERADDLRVWRQAQAAAAEWVHVGSHRSHLWPQERLAPVHEALARLGLDRASVEEPARSFLRPETDWLLEEVRDEATPHFRRAEVGDRLDRIGDPRPGVGLRPDGVPDLEWCEIPGGVVVLEEVKDRFEVAAFALARYPVTYRQYRAFLDAADGYRDPRWWKGLEREEAPGEQNRPTGNCPAENVSWHDAVAFSRWLSARLGYEVRLPTEPEWQQAATGGDPGRVYPWGADWVEGRANTNESHLGRTTAVGLYPRGASAHGVLDLSGDVREWCLTDYENPSKVSAKARRVVRGGSWPLPGLRALRVSRQLRSRRPARRHRVSAGACLPHPLSL